MKSAEPRYSWKQEYKDKIIYGGESFPNRVYLSQRFNPEEWPKVRRFWCPVWLQPFVFWVLRKLEARRQSKGK